MKIIGLAGKLGSGKSTLSDQLPDIIRSEFPSMKNGHFFYFHLGAPIKQLVSNMMKFTLAVEDRRLEMYDNPSEFEFLTIPRDYPSSNVAQYGMTSGQLMQSLGVMYKSVNEDIWVADAFRRSLYLVSEEEKESKNTIMVFDGVRFRSDVNYVSRIPGKSMFIRPIGSFDVKTDRNRKHISERDLDEFEHEFMFDLGMDERINDKRRSEFVKMAIEKSGLLL